MNPAQRGDACGALDIDHADGLIGSEPTANTASRTTDAHALAQINENYGDAKKAIAACVRVVEAKEWRKAEGFASLCRASQRRRAYGAVRRIKRAERRIGELIKVMPKAKGAAQKGVGKRGVSGTPQIAEPPSLADNGVDKNLAKRARSAAGMPSDKFEHISQRSLRWRSLTSTDRKISFPRCAPNYTRTA